VGNGVEAPPHSFLLVSDKDISGARAGTGKVISEKGTGGGFAFCELWGPLALISVTIKPLKQSICSLTYSFPLGSIRFPCSTSLLHLEYMEAHLFLPPVEVVAEAWLAGKSTGAPNTPTKFHQCKISPL
jgi:hypothetical protein